MLPMAVRPPMPALARSPSSGRGGSGRAAHQPSEASSAASAALPTTTPTMHAVPQVPLLPRPPPAAAAPSALTSAAPQKPKPAGPSGATSLGAQRSGVVQPSTSGAGPASGEQREPGRPSAAPPPPSSAGSALRLKPPGAGAHSSGSVRSGPVKHCGSASGAVRLTQPRSSSSLRRVPQPRQRRRQLHSHSVTGQCGRWLPLFTFSDRAGGCWRAGAPRHRLASAASGGPAACRGWHRCGARAESCSAKQPCVLAPLMLFAAPSGGVISQRKVQA